ncbi:MAG: DNA topoisomerase IV subunit A [Planctomyces sp.]|nr:DNA topoisomerase IV subunit A [Planctomyces sp.]
MSVIMSRALPDARDGLKPVQRRILFAMYNELGVTADVKFVKCARIIGEVIGKYHPHGNVAAYDALARMAQDFSLREPLVDGQGNFGSIIGLPPAADRYTEARLTRIAEELLSELRFQTVDMRSTYDASRDEPVVLPARFPNLLVNGAQGIAVGMATSMPPHNLGEVIRGCIQLIENPQASVAQVMRSIKGPDFPLGGRVVTDRTELRKAYEEGRGSIKVRGEWKLDVEKRKEIPNRIVIHSIPYGVETGPLMEQLGEIRDSRRLPQLVDVADLSDDEHGLRIVVETRSGADPEAVMAYLFKHTALEQNFSYNATCLAPDEHGVLTPQRLDLVQLLRCFLDFRFATVRRRFEFQLAQLERRIHILEGFEIVFDGLDKALKIIRNSDGRQDAAAKLMRAFPLDEEQTFAVLDLALYRISQLEIGRIRDELAEKRKEADRIRGILKSDKKLWGVVQVELEELAKQYPGDRRTTFGSSEEISEFDASKYIVRENTQVVVSAEGWIRRLNRISAVDKLRMREGDPLLAIVPCSTLDNVVFFSSDGAAYTLTVNEVPASTGYGEPLAKFVRMGDGARIVAAISTDNRFTPEDVAVKNQPVPAPYVLVATARGQVARLSLSWYRQVSTKAGRRFCRLREGDRVVHVEIMNDDDSMFLATRKARLLHFRVSDVPVLSGAGVGVRGIKLEADDVVLGAQRLTRPSDVLRAVNDNDKELSFGQGKYEITSRGGRGVKTSHRTGFKTILRPEPTLPDWTQYGGTN